MASASSIASAIANSSKYDYVGSDYSMTSGKGTTSSYKAPTASSFFNSGGILGAVGRNTSNSTVKATVDAITGASAPGSAPNSPSAVSKFLGSSGSSGSSGGSYSGSSGGNYSVSYSVPEPISYIDAPFAEAYGMSASTAYQEALSNNAVRRRVNDLKAAGLNPVLGISNQGAASFYGFENQPDIGTISSFGGSGYGSSGSGKSTSGLLDRFTSQLKYNLPTLIGGAVGLATKSPANAFYGSQIGSAIGNIIKYF